MTHPKTARADHDILDLIRARWSPRAFDPNRPVTRAELSQLFEAARWAPSSRNAQPWHFLVADRATSPGTFDAISGTLLGKNPEWAPSAPVLILVAVRTIRESDGSRDPIAAYDTGQAVAFLALQATAMGLGVRQIGGFDRKLAREVLEVPEPFQPAVLIALGRTGDPADLALASHRAAEREPRERRPIGAFVFDGVWGKGFEPAP
jgi:nitroreductase